LTVSQASAAFGAVLLTANDIGRASHLLADFLRDGSNADAASLEATGVDIAAVRAFAPAVLGAGMDVDRACELGAAWALGRRSIAPMPTWEPVVTSGDVTEEGIDRRTAETLTGLIVGARRSIRLFSAFVDAGGLGVVAVSLAAATRRGVSIGIGYAAVGDKHAAVPSFLKQLASLGDASRVVVRAIGPDRPFPHVKLLSADGERAYIGSANLTWPALTSNVEFGALVIGRHVATLERFFDRLFDPPLPEDKEPE
jgi:phosphatidylserine/phosphatidylglycerophosphate/cardiolipin synthase-like enzyme